MTKRMWSYMAQMAVKIVDLNIFFNARVPFAS
jgi:hypothetical protein